MNNRLNRLYQLMNSKHMDGLVINPGPTLTYLTGLKFHLMERPVVLLLAPPAEPVLVLPQLEMAKVTQARFPMKACSYGDNPASWVESFREGVKIAGINGKKIGVEPNRLRFLELRFLQEAAPQSLWLSGEEVFSDLRITKDVEEIQAMRIAVQLAQSALVETIKLIQIGMTEQEIASELTLQLLRAGSDSEFPFSPIVAAGPNSANPHASPTDRRLIPGDLLVIDWGAAHGGYISDLTRTFAVGEVNSEFQKIALIVEQANAAGREAGKPGIPAGEVDKAAREVITAEGYGEYFIHRTGHGIGIEGHESPYIFGENGQKLVEGMAYTVEPGIYLPDRGGVRIEDNLVVTSTGCETLSDLPRKLLTVG